MVKSHVRQSAFTDGLFQADTPYSAASSSQHLSDKVRDSRSSMVCASTPISPAQFSLAPDPRTWGSAIAYNHHEPDDAIHNPTLKNGKMVDDYDNVSLSSRGFANIGCLIIIALAILMLL